MFGKQFSQCLFILTTTKNLDRQKVITECGCFVLGHLCQPINKSFSNENHWIISAVKIRFYTNFGSQYFILASVFTTTLGIARF